jgi:thymidylate synthase
MMKFDLSHGYPLLTTKKIITKPMVGELIGFIRAYDNAKSFRDLSCNIWNANANETKGWVTNPNRKGTDDLGRIYGVQARCWRDSEGNEIDQLKNVIDKLVEGVDDRRLIVTHWNPGDLNRQALPPCHMTYQFYLNGDTLDMIMYQRSADVPLGIPFNIASYALLLEIVAKITNKIAGTFTHMLGNYHIYEDQISGIELQLERQSFAPPRLIINQNIESLHDIEMWVGVDDFKFENYNHHPTIKFPFSA